MERHRVQSFKTILDSDEHRMAPGNFQNNCPKDDTEPRVPMNKMKKRISLPIICWQEKQFDKIAPTPKREESRDLYQLDYLPKLEQGSPARKKDGSARVPTPIARSNSNAPVLHYRNGFDMLSIDEEISNSRKIEEKQSKDKLIHSWLKGCRQTTVKSCSTSLANIDRTPSARPRLLRNRHEYSKQNDETVKHETQTLQDLGSVKRTYANQRPILKKHFSDSQINLRLNMISERNERPATSDGNEMQKQFFEDDLKKERR